VRTIPILLPLRHPRFRRMWSGQAISAVGDGMFVVALTYAILAHHKTSSLGLVLGAESLALVGIALVGGVVADRFRRSRVMAAADVARLLITVGFALGAASQPLILPVMLAFVMGLGSGIFMPAFKAMMPELVPGEDLAKANALQSVSTRAGQIIGPALGGLVLVLGTGLLAFWIDAATYAVSVVTLYGLHDARPLERSAQTVLGQARSGLAAVRRHTWILTVITQGTIQLILVMAPAVVLLPIILSSRGLMSAYGVMVALQAVGSVTSGMVIAAWQPRRPGLVAVLSLSLLGLQLLCLVLTAPLFLLGASMVATGCGYTVFGVLWASGVQRSVPDRLLGRVFAIDMLGTYALEPVGLAVAPIAAAWLGVKAVLLVALAVLVASTIIPLFQRSVQMFADVEAGSPPVGALSSAGGG
jgi:MFS family permease